MENTVSRGYKCHLLRMVISWQFLLLSEMALVEGNSRNCSCSLASDFETYDFNMNSQICCLNFSGSTVGTLRWSNFSGMSELKILDLSSSSIEEIIHSDDGSILLEVIYLERNLLKFLPETFLANAPNLRVLHLEENKLQKLPDTFLRESNHLEELYLDFNHLSNLPPGFVKPSLKRLVLSNNTWECSCSLYDELQNYRHLPKAGNGGYELGLKCSTPKHYIGKSLEAMQRSELCRSHGLTALFILLPLCFVLLIMLCWCCGRRKKSKEASFDLAKPETQLATVDRNGTKGFLDRQHHYVPCEVALPNDGEKNILLKNQLMLRPSAALLGSSRDLYEEVEIKLGASVDSLTHPEDSCPASPDLCIEEGDKFMEENKPDVEVVSVTEVLRDSADREKLYLAQSTDYYNLVPGIDLEDSDHCEYENVDLS
ncbi:uncharacterized protein si:ch211-106k21.5 isoform X1 [Erpetoichthys calabaricus]|uniref:uncharacterized protein si:ch211-106k21.5 isoform X1 n=1 Tax=Erpetoichthys calabaricus TaxID=27687 RepID=UPI002234E395|nr:uncharacterized protein si:ch211-106k21.5 isoform X1 [Erpetoichthys calabaricus]